jgi:hypothetical protein
MDFFVQSAGSKRWAGWRMALLVLLVLASFITAQAAATIDEHQHQHGGLKHHCCPACHAGYIPALHTQSALDSAALAISMWRHVPEAAPLHPEELRGLHPTRAPPA